jgi:murein DD-endopeptidase MepM/ murein hydrolase activator NlpD
MFYYTVLGLLSLILPNFSNADQSEGYLCPEIVLSSTLEDYSSQTFTVKDYNRGTHDDINGFYNVTAMGWPVENVIISSGYGHRESCDSCSSYHKGIDFTPGRGENVIASLTGKVVEIGSMNEYGEFVVVQHLVGHNVWHTLYAHLEEDSVPEDIFVGKDVFVGDILGTVGSTGLTTGPHLHFEIRINGHKVNPLPILLNNIQS